LIPFASFLRSLSHQVAPLRLYDILDPIMSIYVVLRLFGFDSHKPPEPSSTSRLLLQRLHAVAARVEAALPSLASQMSDAQKKSTLALVRRIHLLKLVHGDGCWAEGESWERGLERHKQLAGWFRCEGASCDGKPCRVLKEGEEMEGCARVSLSIVLDSSRCL